MTRFLLPICVLFFAANAFAAGPILVDTSITGNAVVWRNGQINYNPETTTAGGGGRLGRLDNVAALALVTEIFQIWEDITIFNGDTSVSTVSLSVSEGTGLGNVDASNLDDHFTYCPPTELCIGDDPPFVLGSARGGDSPLLFDEDGSLTDMILGVGASESILGFAGPRVVARDSSDLFITEAQAVLNGRFIDCPEGAAASDPCNTPEVAINSFKAVIFHEMGHFLGLDHTQVNLDDLGAALSGDETAEENVATMSPLFVGAVQLTPEHDDKVSISTLYPTAAFLSDFCTITGTIFRSDGSTELQGVNVIARRVDSPKTEATSFVSGSLFVGDSDCSEPAGDFQLRGVRPGIQYTLEIEPIAFGFQGGSSIEPCDPPQSGFDAEVASGLFSCTSGGQNISAGTSSSTDFVTTKSQESGGGSGGNGTSSATGSGCSLILHAGSAADAHDVRSFSILRCYAFLLMSLFLLFSGLLRRVFVYK